jgi:hypothetical protein
MKNLIPILILIFTATNYSQNQMATVLGNASLRGTPTVMGKVVTRIAKDARVEVLLTRDDWRLVQTDEYAGWLAPDTVVLDASSDATYPDIPNSLLNTPPQLPSSSDPLPANLSPFEIPPSRIYRRDSRRRCFYVDSAKKKVYVKSSLCR